MAQADGRGQQRMTAIAGHYAPTRKPGVLGVHSVGEFVLGVPKLEQAQDFYAAFGLEVREQGEQLGLHTRADGYRWGRAVPAARKALHHVTFHCFEEDLPRFKRHIEAQGLRLLDPPPGFDGEGLWLRDPDGTLVEIRVGQKTTPNAKAPMALPPTLTGIRNAPYRRNAVPETPRRLSHILMFTPDVHRVAGFYTRVLGLRVSDRSADFIAFLHAVHGSDHHLMAFVKSEAPGLHHLSWDMPSIAAIGLGAMHMADKGYTHGWGFGRHVLGSNYFHYMRDPWGSWSEFSADIDYVPAELDWEAGEHPLEDSFYLWGPTPPPDFVTNHEAEKG
jgi:catechol 2,3-dioxygenase